MPIQTSKQSNISAELAARRARTAALQTLSTTNLKRKADAVAVDLDSFDDASVSATSKKARTASPAPLAAPGNSIKRTAARAVRVVRPLVPYLVAAGTVACLIGAARGYPCTGYDADATQYFTNPNNTIYGFIKGWTSDCEDFPCGQSCSSTSNGGTTCTTIYCPESVKSPHDFVNDVTNAVKSCGYSLVNSVPAGAAIRVANALREKNRWVNIVVNALNLTDVTDPGVLCLHGIQ